MALWSRREWLRKVGMGTAALTLGLHGTAWAQAPAGHHTLHAGPAYTSKDGRDGPKFPSIDVVVRLTGGNGASAPLRAADLKLLSGNTELGSGSSIRSFADTGYGVKAILALDASGSMRGAPLDAIHSSISKFVNQARDQDRVEVITFANDTRIDVPFGTDRKVLGERIQQVKSRGAATRLYDGTLDALAQFDSAPPERRQLILISDGHDEGSQHSIDDVIRQAHAAKVPIDAIGLTRSHPEYLQPLVRIAQETGGSFARANSPQQLDELIGGGIQSMRATPVVVFKVSKLASDGKTHPLDLRWQPEKLTTTVDVHTPSLAQTWYRMPAVWGGCFAAGVILLIVARRRSRKKPLVARIQPPPAPMPVTPPPPVYRSGFTVVEDKGSSQQERGHTPASLQEDVPARPRERAKTRMVAFFDPAQGQRVNLEAIAGPMAGKSVPVAGDFSIGAVEGNQLTIPDDPTLSGFHARILLTDSVLMIEDLQSTNGTFVNGVRLEQGRKLLKPNDEIQMGQSTFRVRSGEQG